MPARLTFHLIHHTHWDREWYLPRAAFQVRLVHAMAEVIRALEQDGSACFTLDGQTILIDDALAIRPEWRARIAASTLAGHLGVGPWYVLADELIPSGESLLRNLLEGCRDTRALGGEPDALYSPDAFGHPAALPMLAAEFGVQRGALWRGLGGERADHDLYRWTAPDGRSILLYHLPRAGYEFGVDLLPVDDGLASRWAALRRTLIGRARSPHIAVMVGADHHAPCRDPAALRDAIERLEPDASVTSSTLGEYLSSVARAEHDAVSISGELRASYGHTWSLQGVHSTRARQKRRHSIIELMLLRRVEPLVALGHGSRRRDLRALLRATWRTMLQCQFHDTICGCASDAVAAEQDARLTSVHAAAHELGVAAIDALVGHDADAARDRPALHAPALIVWNPLPRARGGVVMATVAGFVRDTLVGPPGIRLPREGRGYAATSLRTSDGSVIPVQVLARTIAAERVDSARHYPDQDMVERVTIAFDADELPGLGFAMLTPSDTPVPDGESYVEVTTRRLANRLVEVHIDDDGQVDLIDRRSGEHYLDLFRITDTPDRGDSYSPDLGAEHDVPVRLAGREVLAAGPLVGVLRLHFTMPAREDCFTLTLQLRAESAALRAVLALEHRGTDHRFRLRFASGVGGNAIVGAAFGIERRAPVEQAVMQWPAERVVATAPAHRYVATAAGTRGLALFVPGFAEYEWTAGGSMMLTVLRAVGELSRDNLTTRTGHAGWPMPIPAAQEPGAHVMHMAAAPIVAAEADRPDQLEQMWEELFAPPLTRHVREYTGVHSVTTPVMTLRGDGLVFSALRPGDQGHEMIFRCWNALEVTANGSLCITPVPRRVRRVRADETTIETLSLADDGVVTFSVPARSIVTLAIEPALPG